VPPLVIGATAPQWDRRALRNEGCGRCQARAPRNPHSGRVGTRRRPRTAARYVEVTSAASYHDVIGRGGGDETAKHAEEAVGVARRSSLG